MRGKILSKALEILSDTAMNQVDFFSAVLVSGYGASMGKVDYEYKKRRRTTNAKKSQQKELEERKRRLTIFISKMKHDGLIKELDNQFIISDKGREKLDKLKNNLPDRHYNTSGPNNSVIISFDIPERLRRKRNWLREVIKNLGFVMIHQSVWTGKTKIPKDFILDLEKLKILEYVEIFEISKIGSLKKII